MLSFLDLEADMLKRILFSAMLLGVFPFASVYAADTYKIDQAHSYIGFSVRHMVISNVKGNFANFSGTITFDEHDITKSSVNVKINAASVNTDNVKRDNHLRSASFFEVEKYPEITFESSSIEKKDDQYIMHGFLTMHGVKKEIAIPFEMIGRVTDPRGNDRIGFEGSTELNRRDYGVNYDAVIEGGGLVAGNNIKIDLQIEAVKSRAEEADSSK
jgi:polyisoprenoid-binding protein YceI